MTEPVRRYLDPALPERLASTPAPRRALFLDRDGVVNVDHGYVFRKEQAQWVDGIFDLCRQAIDAGCLLVVVTNQAGIARGLYSEADFLTFTAWMHAEFERRGTPLAATYYCPHHPTAGLGAARIACACRKPAPGMPLAAIDALGLDPAKSLLVGDKRSDIESGLAAGIGMNVLVDGDEPPAGARVRALRSIREAAPIAAEWWELH